MNRQDKIYIILTIFIVLYSFVLHYSKCEIADGPFAFVRGCYNDGIDWNSFMAPIGFLVICILPFTFFYWIIRFFGIATTMIKQQSLRLSLRYKSNKEEAPK